MRMHMRLLCLLMFKQRICFGSFQGQEERNHFRKSDVLQKQIAKAVLFTGTIEDMVSDVPTTCETSLAESLVQEMKETSAIYPKVHKFNPSIYSFCRAKRMEQIDRHSTYCTNFRQCCVAFGVRVFFFATVSCDITI